ncbi:MAG: hypothetical protein Q8J78_03010 [Moraxellaceae bacterium]|nr:hypothetical protein [Moraxellaceae bacterium]
MNDFTRWPLSPWWFRTGLALLVLPVVVMAVAYALAASEQAQVGFAQRHEFAIAFASRLSIAGVVMLSVGRLRRNVERRAQRSGKDAPHD